MAEAEPKVTTAEISPMEEPEAAIVAAEEAPPASEAALPAEDPAPAKETDAPQEDEAAPAAPVGPSEPDEILAADPDHKRKLEDLEQPREDAPEEMQDVCIPPPAKEAAAAVVPDEAVSDSALSVVEKAPETVAPIPNADPDAPAPAKRQRLDGEADGSAFAGEQEAQNAAGEQEAQNAAGEQEAQNVSIPLPSAFAGEQEAQNLEAMPVVNGEPPCAENTHHVLVDNLQTSNAPVPEQGSVPYAEQQPLLQPLTTSRKFEVPNNKVGVLIGRSGETIKILQHNSGAKIQITRDTEADLNSSTRPVEIVGTLESIDKAEQLIKDVIAEAEAGGSPSLVARGFGNAQSGTEQQEIHVPNEKVGLIIGKGGETIKNLQTRSGARIQLIPQHLPEGDASKERTVRVTGNKKQIEAAKEMIKEVMNQTPSRHSPLAGGYNHQTFRPRGPSPLSQWGARAPTTAQPATGYDYQQRGMYPPQSTQYPAQPYGSYTQQPPPSSSTSTLWDQRAAAPVQTGGYDYYGQGGQAIDNQSSNIAPAPSPAPVNYNYGQSQAAGYGQPTPYSQSAPTQQNYGHGYNEQKYDNQAPGQQFYGQQLVSSQPGAYPQQGGTPQADYAQQQSYSKPAYGGAPQSYGPPRASQPGDPIYQGATPSYGSGGPTQQSYPYGQSAPSQPAPAYGQAYGPTSGTTDGYTQPTSAAGYPQHSGQVAPGYAQGGQPVSAYTQQGVQSVGYGQYPSSQPSYGDQPVPNNVNYGYQGGSADSGYGGNNIQTSGYGSAPVGTQAGYAQAGYAQPQSYPTGYEQSVPPQSGYGSQPGSAPVGYTKGLSPQPGYGGQYDLSQMYGHH